MRILFVGGTRFVGRAMADCALGRGHDVTLLHRGTAQTSGLDSAEHLYADRNGDLSVLDEREFDATIDTSAYVPRQVTSLAKALGDRGGHHIFVSTISVYTSTGEPGVDESGDLEKLVNPTTEEVTGETYGALKALCEEEAREAYGKDAVAVVRPTFVAGPHDHTGRFTWWIRRIAHGGEVLAPGPPDAPTQIIDARDQAEWAITLAEEGTAGTFNSASPTPPFGFGDLLEATVRAVGPRGTTLSWADPEWLVQQGETFQSLPLWTGPEPEWVLAADTTAAISTGLAPRPLTDTITDTWEWIKAEQPPLVPGWGISSQREAELLRNRIPG